MNWIDESIKHGKWTVKFTEDEPGHKWTRDISIIHSNELADLGCIAAEDFGLDVANWIIDLNNDAPKRIAELEAELATCKAERDEARRVAEGAGRGGAE